MSVPERPCQAGAAELGMVPVEAMRAQMAALAPASVDYRLSGEALSPAQVDDVRSACRQLFGDEASPARGLPLVLFGVFADGQIATFLLDQVLSRAAKAP